MSHDPTNATLIHRSDLTEMLSIVRVRPDSGRVPEFEPGQFFRLGLPKPPRPGDRPGRVRYTRRAYSVGSSPQCTEYAEFFVARVEEGQLTPRLWDIPVGGRVWMDSVAKGEFTIDLAPAGVNLAMLATGTGIAPFVSMLRTFREQGRWRNLVLINGTRRAADLGYRDELEQISRIDPTVSYIPITSREPDDGVWTGLRGRIPSVLEPKVFRRLAGFELVPEECHVFLCGNPAMITTVEDLLRERGFLPDQHEQRGNLHFERYW